MHTSDLNAQERAALIALLKVFWRDPEPIASQETVEKLIGKIEHLEWLDKTDAGRLGLAIDTTIPNLKKKLGLRTDT